MADKPAKDEQFKAARAVLVQQLETYHRALVEAKGENEHTDSLRAHLTGSRLMFRAVFGKSEGYRLDEAVEKKAAFELPPMGPRVDGEGKLRG